MTPDPNQQTQPAALPFWKSPMFLSVLIALLTKLIVLVPNIAQAIGLSASTISNYASGIALAIGSVADFVALQRRKNFKIQPLTGSQKSADVISSNNTPVLEVKK